MDKRYYYAIISDDGTCIGLLDTYVKYNRLKYIPISGYDETLVGHKKWTGLNWINNPSYVPPEEVE
ncbi:MAG: hypothetical protein ACK5MV_00415 [Aminipila sp.]